MNTISSDYGKNVYSNVKKSSVGGAKIQSSDNNAKISRNADSVEISDKAYKSQQDKISASSGGDILGISRGAKENSFTVHFSDSAMVNRAVSRGYIAVNGIRIDLSDETKKKLLSVDREANIKREAAFRQSVMDFQKAVLNQQSEVMKEKSRKEIKAMNIAAKISSGKKTSDKELQFLLHADPKLYEMAMLLRKPCKDRAKSKKDDDDLEEKKIKGVSWSDFEQKSYETQVKVSLDGTPSIENISEAEIILQNAE